MAMYYSDFENRIIEFILSNLSEEERKAYDDENERQNGLKRKFKTDLILPKGCVNLGWNHYTFVEIKRVILFDTSYTVLQKFKKRYKKNEYELKLIYISNSYVSLSDKRKGIQILSSEELFSLSKKWRCNSKTKKQEKSQTTKEPISECKEAFQKGNCSLFIGAGVSISANLLGWEDMLYSVLENAIKKKLVKNEDKVFFRRAFDGSYIVMGRYLRILSQQKSWYKSNDALVQHVRKALYAQVANKKSELIKSIINLVHYDNRGNEKRKIKEIITYNYDDLLEWAISNEKKLIPKSYSINNPPKERDNKNCFPIYHVHGLIQNYYKKVNYDDTIVLSEETYHELYRDSEEWSNNEQSKALKNRTCIFIGMSLNDPNLRRLLEDVRYKGGKRKHFAFLSEKDFFSTLSFLPQKDIVEEMFYELGVQVIWFNEYEELPNLLNSLIGNKQQNINQ